MKASVLESCTHASLFEHKNSMSAGRGGRPRDNETNQHTRDMANARIVVVVVVFPSIGKAV